MIFSTTRNRPSTRTRSRRPRPFGSAVERLEVRSLLSSAAVIDYAMTPQIAPDPAHGNQPDLPNTPAYVSPPGGYGLTLDASHSKGILPTSTFSWKVSGPKGFVEYFRGEQPTLSLPQGKYKVGLEATGLAGSKPVVATSTTIQVKDVLIVSIGDSYASGEGNPVVAGTTSILPGGPGLPEVPGASPISYIYQPPQWAYSPDPAMNLENALAHRSTISGPAQFALALQRANPHEAVTFVSVANSGASIKQGLLGPMASVGDPTVQLPAEIAEVGRIIGNRHIDALTLSIGGNDVNFIGLLQGLIQNNATGTPTLADLGAQATASFKALPGLYAQLGKAIKGLGASRVLATGYPDLTRNQAGAVAAILGPDGSTLINLADAQLASKGFADVLNQAVYAGTRANRWTFVYGILSDFLTHGYPSTDTWYRQVAESLAMQGTTDGAFHPNAAGVADFARRILAAYQGRNGK